MKLFSYLMLTVFLCSGSLIVSSDAGPGPGSGTINLTPEMEQKRTMAGAVRTTQSDTSAHYRVQPNDSLPAGVHLRFSLDESPEASDADTKKRSETENTVFHSFMMKELEQQKGSVSSEQLGSHLLDVPEKEIDKELAEQALALNTSFTPLIQKLQRNVPGTPTKILLVGPPGTGKTVLVKALAQALKRTCVMHSGTAFSHEFQGSGKRNLSNLFARIKMDQPCVIAIDELQILVNSHHNTRHDDSSMLTHLWKLLDYYATNTCLFIGIANYTTVPNNLVGRFDEIIFLSLPNEQQRKSIIQFYEKRLRLALTPTAIDTLITNTTDFSIRDVEKLMKQVASAIHIQTKEKPITDTDLKKMAEDLKNSAAQLKEHAPESDVVKMQKASLALQIANLDFQLIHYYKNAPKDPAGGYIDKHEHVLVGQIFRLFSHLEPYYKEVMKAHPQK